jgi:hypothetical protein
MWESRNENSLTLHEWAIAMKRPIRHGNLFPRKHHSPAVLTAALFNDSHVSCQSSDDSS